MSTMLIKYSDNWADEMDLEGLFICSSEEVGRIQRIS